MARLVGSRLRCFAASARLARAPLGRPRKSPCVPIRSAPASRTPAGGRPGMPARASMRAVPTRDCRNQEPQARTRPEARSARPTGSRESHRPRRLVRHGRARARAGARGGRGDDRAADTSGGSELWARCLPILPHVNVDEPHHLDADADAHGNGHGGRRGACDRQLEPATSDRDNHPPTWITSRRVCLSLHAIPGSLPGAVTRSAERTRHVDAAHLPPRHRRPSRRPPARRRLPRPGGADLPDHVLRLRVGRPRRRRVRAEDAGQHLHAHHEPDHRRARGAPRATRRRRRGAGRRVGPGGHHAGGAEHRPRRAEHRRHPRPLRRHLQPVPPHAGAVRHRDAVRGLVERRGGGGRDRRPTRGSSTPSRSATRRTTWTTSRRSPTSPTGTASRSSWTTPCRRSSSARSTTAPTSSSTR